MKIRECDHSSGDQDNGCNQNLNQRKAVSFCYFRSKIPHNLILARRRLNNQAGYSLIELLVAVAIALVSIVAIWYMLLAVQSQFSSLQNKVNSEIELNELMFTVEHYLGMGVDLSFSDTPLPSTVLFNGSMGKIAAYSLSNPTTPFMPVNGPGKIDTLAYFLRDSLSSRNLSINAPIGANRFIPTGIFFQRPTIDKYGVLYVNFQNNPNAVNISPNYQDYFFEGIVDLKILNPVTSVSEIPPYQKMVSSVTFMVTQRNFVATMSGLPLKWCPPDKMTLAACGGTRPYVDLVKVFTVKIRNNVLGESTTQRKGGQIIAPNTRGPYPATENRVFGNIYFLRPAYPTGALKR